MNVQLPGRPACARAREGGSTGAGRALEINKQQQASNEEAYITHGSNHPKESEGEKKQRTRAKPRGRTN